VDVLGAVVAVLLLVLAFAATAPPVVVVTAVIGAGRGLVGESVSAAVIRAAMVSVLLFPLIGLRWARTRSRPS
jgi:hypothetical protein